MYYLLLMIGTGQQFMAQRIADGFPSELMKK
jgi:hypothetical protein